MAFHYQQLEIAAHLFDKGADLEHLAADGKSALLMLLGWHRHYNWHRHYSTDWQADKFNNILPCLKFLAYKDFAHFDTPSLNGETPLHLAASCGIPFDGFQAILGLGKSFSTAEQYEEILSDAVLGGDRRILSHVLTAIDPRLSGKSSQYQEALLHEAVEENNYSKVSLLLSQGVNVNAPRVPGYTPLHKAIISGSDISIIDLLVQHHADVNVKDVRGNTPIHHVVALSGSSSAPILKALFESGADPHIQGEIGYWMSRPPYFNDPYFEFWSVRATTGDCVSAFKDKFRVLRYFTILRKYYPEVTIDKDGDIFWNANEEPDRCTGKGGSSYEWCKVYDGLPLRKWLNRRVDLRTGALHAWKGEWAQQSHPEKTILEADQFPTIAIIWDLMVTRERLSKIKERLTAQP